MKQCLANSTISVKSHNILMFMIFAKPNAIADINVGDNKLTRKRIEVRML